MAAVIAYRRRRIGADNQHQHGGISGIRCCGVVIILLILLSDDVGM